LAAQSVASCAARLGAVNLRTAVSEADVVARLTEHPAELILADTAITRPDTVGFTRRVLELAPGSVLVLFGAEEPEVAAAAVEAGARGLIRGGDQDVVGTVAKALLLIGSASRAQAGAHSGSAVAGPVAGPGAPPGPGTAPVASGGVSRLGLDRVAERAAERGPAAGHRGTLSPRLGAAGANGASRVRRAPPTMVPVQRGDPPPEGAPRRTALTQRELQVLRGMADGRSNAEIGRELFVSEDTVKTHARRLFRKLGARDRAHAVAVGFRSGALR
jgi:DNA-binding NarL/FixJ family response regulator